MERTSLTALARIRDEIEFIAAWHSFYMATISENNWPYLQHRGGPKGFLCVIDPKKLAFLDLLGNRPRRLSDSTIAAQALVDI